jgi:hypothetical protein
VSYTNEKWNEEYAPYSPLTTEEFWNYLKQKMFIQVEAPENIKDLWKKSGTFIGRDRFQDNPKSFTFRTRMVVPEAKYQLPSSLEPWTRSMSR